MTATVWWLATAVPPAPECSAAPGSYRSRSSGSCRNTSVAAVSRRSANSDPSTRKTRGSPPGALSPAVRESGDKTQFHEAASLVGRQVETFQNPVCPFPVPPAWTAGQLVSGPCRRRLLKLRCITLKYGASRRRLSSGVKLRNPGCFPPAWKAGEKPATAPQTRWCSAAPAKDTQLQELREAPGAYFSRKRGLPPRSVRVQIRTRPASTTSRPPIMTSPRRSLSARTPSASTRCTRERRAAVQADSDQVGLAFPARERADLLLEAQRAGPRMVAISSAREAGRTPDRRRHLCSFAARSISSNRLKSLLLPRRPVRPTPPQYPTTASLHHRRDAAGQLHVARRTMRHPHPARPQNLQIGIVHPDRVGHQGPPGDRPSRSRLNRTQSSASPALSTSRGSPPRG